jgi:hypothetical protein
MNSLSLAAWREKFSAAERLRRGFRVVVSSIVESRSIHSG